MACSKCGAKRGHLGGCPTLEGQKSTAGQKKGAARGHGKGLLKGEGKHECRTCDGTGTITEYTKIKGKWQNVEKTCYACKGTGEI